jgi:hypothetical protein
MTAVLGIAPSSSTPGELQTSSSASSGNTVMMRAYQSAVAGATGPSNQPPVL